jgi:NADH:ubiquinone oxidoreductase subunit 5 (subunit L)/multisubunit Na+/H+ antiporter MnhA subunit
MCRCSLHCWFHWAELPWDTCSTAGILRPAQADPTQRLTGAGYWRLLQDRYRIDAFYHWAFVRPSRWISEVFTYQILDRKIIDGFLEGVARFTLVIGVFFRRYIDLAIVNWLGDKTGDGTRGLGSILRFVQTGSIQTYMLLSVLVLVLVGAIFLVLA